MSIHRQTTTLAAPGKIAMRFSENISTISTALVSACAEIKSIQKDATNPHFKNRYATLDTILAEVRPILARHDITILQGMAHPDTDSNGVLRMVAVETILLHKSGEYIANTAMMPIAKNDPQGAGGALTYGRRYGLAALLSLATEDDDDGNTASGLGAPASRRDARETSRRAPPARQQQQKPASETPRAPTTVEDALAFTVKRNGERVPLAVLTDDELAKTLDHAKVANRSALLAAVRLVINDRLHRQQAPSAPDRPAAPPAADITPPRATASAPRPAARTALPHGASDDSADPDGMTLGEALGTRLRYQGAEIVLGEQDISVVETVLSVATQRGNLLVQRAAKRTLQHLRESHAEEEPTGVSIL